MLQLASLSKNRKRSLIIFYLIILFFQLIPTNISGHNVRNIEIIELDISPEFEESRFGTIPVIIDQDSTIISVANVYHFTTQDVMVGYFNFSNLELQYDGMEAYQTILHQKFFFEDTEIADDLELGRRSQKLSDSALHDGELSFAYNLQDLNDLSWSAYWQSSETIDWFDKTKDRDKVNFTIEISIEFIRGTKQNARFDLNYNVESYTSPDIPLDNFHFKQKMNSSVLPERIDVDGSLTQGTSTKVYLLLPDELVPRHFVSSEEHKLNLTKIPLKITIQLELSNSNNLITRMFKIKSNGYSGSLKEKDENSESYQFSIMLTDKSLIPIAISSLGFVGDIKIKITLEMRSLFADTGLYAKNTYFFSPNQYLIMLSFIGTVFNYKLVDYVGYRTYENTLARKNYGLVEEEFMR